MRKVNPCLWFNNNGEEAAKFYTSLFKNSKVGKVAHYGEAGAKAAGQKINAAMTIEFAVEGMKILGLNGGSHFQPSPSLSFFVWCESEKEIEDLWKSLSQGGTARMKLDKYPWAEKYAWTSDKYGVEWQLMLKSHSQKIAPSFLFTDELFGRGEEAVKFYTSLFKNSKIDLMARDEASKSIMHCVFSLDGQDFVLMEGQGKHGHQFTNAFSLVVNCDTQDEIDSYWSKLSEGGSTSQCGWLKDKFGVSWQIVPSQLGQWVQDPKKSDAVMSALVQMSKLDLNALKRAYEK
jgi:predicted 3-demethylubiquinone-9 3-methyltransferase (glyoxalase superfamily)